MLVATIDHNNNYSHGGAGVGLGELTDSFQHPSGADPHRIVIVAGPEGRESDRSQLLLVGPFQAFDDDIL